MPGNFGGELEIQVQVAWHLELEIQVQVARHLATQADCQYPGLTLVTVAERPWPGKLQLGWPALGLAVKAAAAPSAAE